jgi:hypothetical protein
VEVADSAYSKPAYLRANREHTHLATLLQFDGKFFKLSKVQSTTLHGITFLLHSLPEAVVLYSNQSPEPGSCLQRFGSLRYSAQAGQVDIARQKSLTHFIFQVEYRPSCS